MHCPIMQHWRFSGFLQLWVPILICFQIWFAGYHHHGSSAPSNVIYIQQLQLVPDIELLALMCQFGQNWAMQLSDGMRSRPYTCMPLAWKVMSTWRVSLRSMQQHQQPIWNVEKLNSAKWFPWSWTIFNLFLFFFLILFLPLVLIVLINTFTKSLTLFIF